MKFPHLRWTALAVAGALLAAGAGTADAASGARPASGGPAPAPSSATPAGSASATDPWTLTSTDYSAQDITKDPFVGNGYLGQRLPAVGQGYQGQLGPSGYQLDQRPKQRLTTSLVAGVYNKGLSPSVPGVEYLASLPTWTTMRLGVDGQQLDPATPASAISAYRQRLDLAHATVSTSLRWTPEAGRATDVTVDVLANRALEHLGQVRITVTPQWSGDLSLAGLLDGGSAQGIDPTGRSVDLAGDTASVQLSTPGDGTRVVETQRLVAAPGTRVSARAADEPADTPATAGTDWTIPVTAGTTYTVTKYVGIATSLDGGDPAAVAAATADQAAHQGWPELMRRHDADWAALWKPNIRLAGDGGLQADVDSAYYTLYSSLRAGTSWSIAPAGLTSQDYNGDIFWDADTWMFPALLALHPELARSIVMFRSRTRAQAEADAAANGYRGGIWAWDNGPGGDCGDLGHPMCVGFEDHLESDIALAQWQYYEATGDTGWLRSYGYPVLRDVAEFWASRVTLGADGKYHIDGVTGPDEYHEHVNDNATTNAGAVVALRDAVAAARALGLTPGSDWAAVADRIAVPTDPDGSHPEYAGYTDQTVKQADTVMLSYPFDYTADPASAAADLNRYMPVTDPSGPAMTYSVESVVADRLRQPGCLGYTLFEDSYLPYLQGPYRQFSETQGPMPLQGDGTGPAFTFATGAGGFLQTFLSGFGGLDWSEHALRLAPTLPPQLAHGVVLGGIRYHGSTLTAAIGPQRTTVTLDSGQPVRITTPDGTGSGTTTAVLTRGRPLSVPTARPDLSPTDDLARCRTASADSALPAMLPAAAVDGNDTTAWTAAATASAFQLTLAAPSSTARALLHWGATRPADYTAEIQDGSGAWRQVAQGTVPAQGDLAVQWPSAETTALRFSFSGGDPASLASLSVPRAEAAHLSGTLTAPQGLAPGASGTVRLDLASDGGSDARDVVNHLQAPAGWQVSPDPGPTAVPRGGHAEELWTVTPPADQPTTAAALTATTSWDGVAARDSGTASAVLPVVRPAALGSTVEAEDGALSGGAQLASDHGGYTGRGFVAGLYGGAADTVLVHVPAGAGGGHSVVLRYANSLGGQRPPLQNTTRTLSLLVGGAVQQVALPVTGSWDTWSTVTAQVNLPVGDDPITLLVGPGDSGSVNLDSITVH